nr:transposase [uncultured Bariatricus sp.]
MKNPTYYTVTTRKFILRCNHQEWLERTRMLYNEVLQFYYELYLNQQAQLNAGSQQVMRSLEQLTIVGRDKKEVPFPLPWEKIPLYFRRAAINAAIAAGKSYLARDRQWKQTEKFTASVTFYKGMYKRLNEKSVELKVWDGEAWRWLHCRLSGNTFSPTEECLSPSVVLKGQQTELHVPVREAVPDGRKAKERIADGENIAAVQFTNRDRLAVLCVMDSEGEQKTVRFIKGGAEYAHLCRKVQETLERSQKATGNQTGGRSNQKYWMKLKYLNEYYSHKFSREIVEYCVEHQASVLVLPVYSEDYSKYVMKASGNWSALHLSNQIREKLKYKAWKAGIVVLETDAAGVSSQCAVCGKQIRKKDAEFVCPEGHSGNRYLNAAINLGRKCLKSFGKQVG